MGMSRKLSMAAGAVVAGALPLLVTASPASAGEDKHDSEEWNFSPAGTGANCILFAESSVQDGPEGRTALVHFRRVDTEPACANYHVYLELDYRDVFGNLHTVEADGIDSPPNLWLRVDDAHDSDDDVRARVRVNYHDCPGGAGCPTTRTLQPK
jgi:hypothetical protein